MKVKAYYQRWRLIAVGAVAAIIQVAPAQQDNLLRVAYADGKITVTASPNAAVDGNKSILLRYGLTPGRESGLGWEHSMVVTDELTAEGGEWTVDAAEYGIPEGVVAQAVAGTVIEQYEYLESDGTHYLDTGVKHVKGDAVQMDFLLAADGFNSADNFEFYGARDDVNGVAAVEAFMDPDSASGKGLLVADFRNANDAGYRIAYSCPSGSYASFLCRKHLLLNLDSAGPRLTATDGSVSVRSAKGYTGSLSLSHSAYVFAVNNAGWKPAKNMRLYALTITRNGNQYREYIPTRDANGLPCLRDVVSSISPITSSGNSFTLGDSVGKVIIRPDEISVSPSIFVTSRVLAEIEDRRVLPDGEAHTVEVNISYPSSGDGCLVQWAWTDNPSDQDFIHSEPCGYREVGVYTNVVRVMDLNYALKPYVATGVVEIVPPLKLERREDGKLRIVLEPGAVEDKAPLQLGWGLSDAGDNFAAWEHLVTVDPAATAAGGEYEVDLVAAGIPEVAYCRAFAVPWIWKLDYLQADGKNYLDTGIRHQTHDVIDLRFTMDTLESGNVGIYGSRDGDGDDEVSVLINTTSGAKMILDFWNNPANFGDRLTLTFGTQFAEILGRPVRVRLSQSEIYLATEDGTYQSVRKSTPSVINCSNTAYIFGCYDWNTTHPAPPQGIKLNELTVTREGELYRHYLPALTPGGEAGLYDTVTGEYLSKSTASFGGAETKQILPLVDPTYAGSSSLLVYGDSTAVLAVTEGAAGVAGDGVYRASVRVVYPSQGEGCRVKWAWTGAPDAEDFVHDEPCGYAAAGVYTNVVCVTDLTGTLTPYFGTGIVEVVSTVATELSADGERMTITVAPQVVEPGMAAKLVLAWGAEDRGGDYLDWEHWQMVKGDLSADGDAVEVTIGELPGEFGPFYRAFVVDAQFALLRYLESTGSEYIDLGRKISAADRVELELEFPTLPTGAFGIFGSRKTYAEACYCVNASIKDGIGTLALMVNSDGETGYGTRSAKDANISLGAHYTLIGGGGEKGVITRSEGGVTTVFTAPEATAKTFTSALNARLFDVAEEIDDTFDPSKGRVRIFSCVINGGATPNGMNLVAARRNDGTLGMYDLVSGDFLEKAPSCQGAFVAGPETGCIGTGVVCSPAGNTSGKVVATLTDYKGFYDGEAHAIGIDISYPGFGEGCEVKWAWRGNPREQDFVHDLPGSYVEPGCYTNVVRIVDAAGTLAPFVGTGAVEIVRMVEARGVSGSKAIYARVRPQVVPQGTTARLVLWWDSEDRGEQAADWAHWAVLDDEVTAAGVEVRRACEELGIGKGDVFRVAVVSKDYDRLEYLESNKREYIEFPRKLHNADSVVLAVSFPEVPTGNFGVFGARDDYNSSAYTISANATAVSFSINSDTDYQNYAATVNHAAKVDARYVFTGGNGVKTAIAEILGETTNRIEAASATAKNFVTTPSMRLFDLAEQTGDVFSPANGKARVYSLVINGGRQVDGMDLIPVRRADGTLGMYDRTDGAFYGNSSGSGSFAAGPVIGFDPSIRFSTLAVSPAKVLRGRGLLIIFKGLQE